MLVLESNTNVVFGLRLFEKCALEKVLLFTGIMQIVRSRRAAVALDVAFACVIVNLLAVVVVAAALAVAELNFLEVLAI